MRYQQELKDALKELKSQHDFAYQAGVNDTLDLLEEMEAYILLENDTQEVTQKITQEASKDTEFSALKQLRFKKESSQELTAIHLEVPEVSTHISDEMLFGQDISLNEEEKEDESGGEKREESEEESTQGEAQEGIQDFRDEALKESQEVPCQEFIAPSLSLEEQEELKKAQLLAEARAQAQAEAEELEEEDYDE
ncbi:hypothetical protein [Lactococcus taiwanensis]|uniref:hypothetical protein n=1 Tax=Lactococcus taiwanensis TaxID=1151742 RepID=UPI0035128615